MSRNTIILVAAAVVAGVGLSVALSGLAFRPPAPGDGKAAAGERAAPSPPRRVICMSPAVTEIVFALGQGERVVGISQYTTYPPEAREKPECGGFFNPNFERILMLEPDIVISQGIGRKVNKFCRRRDISFLAVKLTDLDSIFRAIRQIGGALGCPKESERLRAEMRRRLDAVAARARDGEKADVLLLLGRESGSLRSLNTAGPGSFLHDVLELAGGRNIFEDVERRYAPVSKEAVLTRRPDVIIELHGEGMLDAERLSGIRRLWSSLPSLPAVRNGRIYAVGETYAMLPGPRVVDLAERLERLIHLPDGAEEP